VSGSRYFVSTAECKKWCVEKERNVSGFTPGYRLGTSNEVAFTEGMWESHFVNLLPRESESETAKKNKEMVIFMYKL